jgi:hypothetical protein
MLNIYNNVLVVHSLSEGSVAEMVLNIDKHEGGGGGGGGDSDDDNDDSDDTVNMGEKSPTNMVKLCDQ